LPSTKISHKKKRKALSLTAIAQEHVETSLPNQTISHQLPKKISRNKIHRTQSQMKIPERAFFSSKL
jgi:hypothetical protein